MSNPREPTSNAGVSANAGAPVPVATDTQPVGRAWIVVGSIVVLIGIVMGFVMSSLGR